MLEGDDDDFVRFLKSLRRRKLRTRSYRSSGLYIIPGEREREKKTGALDVGYIVPRAPHQFLLIKHGNDVSRATFFLLIL